MGDAPDSYAYDGKRLRKWSVKCLPYGHAWTTGALLLLTLQTDHGFALDLVPCGVPRMLSLLHEYLVCRDPRNPDVSLCANCMRVHPAWANWVQGGPIYSSPDCAKLTNLTHYACAHVAYRR